MIPMRRVRYQVACSLLVDRVEPAVVPILLGDGVPLLPAPAVRRRLSLVGHHADPSGIVLLEYEVERP